jgi:nuclear migration protein NUM1
MSPSDKDLKSQLSDIQKRLAETKFSTPKRTGSTPHKERETPEGSPASDHKPGPLKQFPSLVSRRDKRVSLPVLDNNRSLSTPSKGSGKDMDFVVGLSENLLQECRRLQAENQHKAEKLKSIEDEFDKLKTRNSNLMHKLYDTVQNEEKYKDATWELEMKLQQLSEEHKSVSENYQKVQKELNKNIDISNEIRSELEEVSLNKHSLEKEFSSTRLTSTNEIQELKSHVDELNDENTRLNDEIDELRKELLEVKNKPKDNQLTRIPILRPIDDSDSEDEVNEPPISPVKTVALNNNALETETLKASLQSAHQTITKLRGQILKLRQNELSSKQQQSPTPKKSTPMPKNSIKNFSDSMKGALHFRGNSNRGSTVIYDDSMNSDDLGDDWENYEGNSFASSPSKKVSRPLSVVSGPKDLIDDSDSDNNSEDLQVAPLSSELKIISEDDVNQYINDHRLVLVPADEFNLLKRSQLETFRTLNSKEEQILNLNEKLTQREISEQQYVREAEEYRKKLQDTLDGLEKEKAISSQLKTQLEEPSHEFITSKASEKNLKVLPIDDHDRLVNEIESSKISFESISSENINLLKKLEDVSAEHKKSRDDLSILQEDHKKNTDHVQKLQDLIDNPSADYISSKSTGVGMIALDSLAYEKSTNDLETKLSVALATIADEKSKHESLESDLTKTIEELKLTLFSTEEELKEKVSVSEQVTHDLKSRLGAAEVKFEDMSTSLVSSQQDLERVTLELSSLQGQLENPSSQYLKEKATEQGLSIIPKGVHDVLLDKANKTLDDLAKEGGFAILKESEFQDLSDKAFSPSLDHLSATAERYGHKIVKAEELTDLETKANKSIDTLAKELSLVVIPDSEHQELLRRSNNPTRRELEESSKALDMVLIPQKQYSDIVQKADKPTAKDLSAAAELLDLIVISSEEVENMKKASSQLSEEIENVKSMSSDINLLKEEVSKKDAYIDELKVIVNEKEENLKREPTLPKESLLNQVGSLGLIAISTSELKKLKHPTRDDIVKHAESHHLAVIPLHDLEDLKLKSSKTIDDLALEQNKVVLSSEDHQHLLHPSKSEIERHAESQGLVVSEQKLFEEMKLKSEKTISEIAREASVVLVPESEHKKLLSPTSEDLSVLAVSHGCIVVPKDSFEEIQSRSKKTVQDLAKESDLVLLSHDDYDALLKPSRDTIVQLASNIGLSAVANNEHQSLKNALEKPSVKFLSEKASALNMTLVEKQHLDELVINSKKSVEDLAKENNLVLVTPERYNELLKPSIEKLQVLAAGADLAIVPKVDLSSKKVIEPLDPNTVKIQVDKLGYAMIEKAELQELREPDENAAVQLCEKFDLHALSKGDFEKLSSESYIVERAENLGYAAIPLEEFHVLKSRAEEPDRVTLESQADKLGCVLVGKKEYQAYEKSLSSVSKSDLESKAQKIDHVLISTADLEELRTPSQSVIETPSTPTSKFHATKEYFENVTKSTEKESRKAKVFESAKSLGFVPVAADEYKHLLEHQKDHIITKSDIYATAKDFSLTVLPSEEYKALLRSRQKEGLTLEELQLYAKQFDLKLVDANQEATASKSSDIFMGVNQQAKSREIFMGSNHSMSTLSSAVNESDFTDALSRQPSNASTIHAEEGRIGTMTVDELRVQASLHGLKLISLREESLREQELSHSFETAGDAGDENSDGEEDRHDTLILKESPVVVAKESLNNQAAELGLVVLDQSEYAHLTTEIGKSELEMKAQSLGLRVVEESDFVSVDHPQEKQIRDLSEKLGLVILSKAELEDIEKRAISSVKPEQVIKQADIVDLGSSMGMHVVTPEVYNNLIEKSKPEAMTKEKLLIAADLLGLVVIDSEEFNKLKAEATARKTGNKSSLGAVAGILTAGVVGATGVAGLAKVVGNTGVSGALEPVASSGAAAAIVSKNETETLSKDDLLKAINSQGLIAMDATEVANLKKHVELSHDRSHITKVLEQDDLTIVPRQEFEDLKKKSEEPHVITKDDILEKASAFNLVTISKEEFDSLKGQGTTNDAAVNEKHVKALEIPPLREISTDDVETWARQHDLLLIPEQSFVATNVSRVPDPQNVVVLPTTYYNKLTKSEVLNLDKVTNDEIQAQAKKRGFQIIYGDVTQNHTLARRASITSVTSSQSRKNLAELAQAAANAEFDQQSVQRLSRANSRATHSRSSSKAPGMTRDFSIDGGLSLITNASLSEPNIIPALTQTVIGEYLHKYYRRLGPFSSISETRHDRYFWVHPYTLTLYWSTTNPVLGNPSTHKTRAAAIIGVESVEDNNPLPAGLYHKSIIVHSQSRSVKFTCPTRQRHNIWYNSLRYLIQRSMDGLEFDDDLNIPAPPVVHADLV